MLANNRSINTIGFIKIPKISMGTMSGSSQPGTPGVLKMCAQ